MLRTAVQIASVVFLASTTVAGRDVPRHVIFVASTENGEIEQTIALPAFPNIFSPEISPDGRYVAMDGWRAGETLTDAHVLIVELKTGELTDLGKGAMPSWSADGRWVAISKYQPDGGVFVRSVDGDEERLVDRDGWGIQWSPDGKQLAYARDGNLVVYNLAAETAFEIFDRSNLPYSYIYWNCKWSPDSERICFKGRRTDGTLEVAIATLADEGVQLTARCPADNVAEDVAWHPFKPMILIPQPDAEIGRLQMFAFDPDGSDPPTRWDRQPADRHNGGMSFSRDGERIVYMSAD
ncbi:MAG: hypothetical protein DWQ34_21565 [Planctomycetota bacterium]|nr:MAG: hypothetical protein DWQ29_09730 [Planctomycetota bacterium]REJ88852.1 MAG: hypothetical protein DWQ34_21565 [Planctomycetota bacterium]